MERNETKILMATFFFALFLKILLTGLEKEKQPRRVQLVWKQCHGLRNWCACVFFSFPTLLFCIHTDYTPQPVLRCREWEVVWGEGETWDFRGSIKKRSSFFLKVWFQWEKKNNWLHKIKTKCMFSLNSGYVEFLE